MRVSLFDRRNNVFTDASLSRMTASHLAMAKSTWGAEFQQREAELLSDEDSPIWTCGILSEAGQSDDPLPKGYVVIHAGMVQGLLLFDEKLWPGRKRPGTWLLYVSYLATAPWNRRGSDVAARFRHVGRSLVIQAVRESIELGCPGRIGLHSFLGASTFFERLGFENLGPDASREGMTYFELRSGAAYTLISETGVHRDILADLA